MCIFYEIMLHKTTEMIAYELQDVDMHLQHGGANCEVKF